MDKILVSEITLILMFFIFATNDVLKSFFMETIFGNVLLLFAFAGYYYLDKYIAIVFCFMILCMYYDIPKSKESFFYRTQDVATPIPVAHPDDTFRKNNCMDKELIYKGNEVKNDMIEHVFPEINFKDDVCNPCDKRCKFSILEQDSRSEEDVFGVSTLA